jgi:dUTP pyrophosphatase
MRVRVDFKKLTDTAKTPTQATKGSAGYDLYADTDSNMMIRPGESAWIGSGIAVEIPPGYVGLIYSRSGLSTKQGLRLANCVGVIDSDYRGEIGLPLHNDSDEVQLIRSHERVAQMILHPICEMDFVEMDNLSDTDRGAGGFGSTGRM